MSQVTIPLWVAKSLAEQQSPDAAAAALLEDAIRAARIRPVTPRSRGLLAKPCLVTVDGEQIEGTIIQDKPEGGALEIAVLADLPTGVDHVEVSISDVSVLVTGEEAVRDVIAGWHETWARLAVDGAPVDDPVVEALKLAHDSVEAALNV